GHVTGVQTCALPLQAYRRHEDKIDRRGTNHNRFQTVCPYALGRNSGRLPPSSLRLLLRYVFPFSSRFSLVYVHSRFYLLLKRIVAMKTNSIVVERITTDSKLFAHTRWDAIPVAATLLHCAYFFGMFYLFPRISLWLMIILGLIYSVSISWNINGISHNFIHNPYFRSPVLNRLFSILESITIGFSQIFYECIHTQHHKGNADLPDETGETVDWISIYKYGNDGAAEHPFKYACFSFFRE